MGKKFILSIDLGTTGNRVFCFSETGVPISSSYSEFKQIFPKPGWVEHDPVEIWDSVLFHIKSAIKNGNLDPNDALTIGITNQRETTVLWNSETGIPIYNAIVWQCRRTTDICNNLKQRGYSDIVRNKTGLVIDAYFSGTKIKWILDNISNARTLASSKKLLFGTIDTWILWKLTGGESHKTDFTNASRTMLLNIIEKKWDDELFEMLDIPKTIMPDVCNSASVFGKTKGLPVLPDGIIIGGIAGDQQAAMVGQGCVTDGSLKNTYGTGCFILQNIGNNFTISKHGLITTLACDDIGNPVYALEGSIFIGGAVMQWMRDYMFFLSNSSEAGDISEAIQNEDDIVFVPAFVGLGAPYWRMESRGAIFGITRDTTREQIVRAAERSIAFQSMDVINAMQNDSGKKIKEIRADGGAAMDKYLMQFQSDILDIPVMIPKITESTALGAAYLAGVTIKLFSKISEVASKNRITHQYVPAMTIAERTRHVNLWEDAISRLLFDPEKNRNSK